ncbi:hypothetical protein C2845_PM06G22020 [Panicum miliaceum]|uniref:Small EDRK-rich factor-like N-terminal domain-containing protein n=1 Tax=Panicum miliaceum TaxID=4540 RepID=A0A3L6RF33_PANMI|nr:hypothetical protein C2845_PM06G22020 [Panicum miliaceum]
MCTIVGWGEISTKIHLITSNRKWLRDSKDHIPVSCISTLAPELELSRVERTQRRIGRSARARRRGPARGDQRERDRQRAQARRPVAKGRDDGLTPEQRRERDAKALQEKAARKAAQAAGGGDAKGGKGAGKNAGKK